MTSYKFLKAFSLLVFLSLAITEGFSQSQCTYTYKIVSKTVLGTGTIEVDVKANGTFNVELYSEQGIEKVLIHTKRGTGNEKIRFTGLSIKGNVYRLAVVLPNEKDFLCKKRMSEEISFDIN